MIPKNLIYCNFGNLDFKDKVISKCMKSWEMAFPKEEWNWIEVNESNFDVNKFNYAKMCYEKKKYGFVSDFARLFYLFTVGGVYIDIDEYMIKPFPNVLLNESFFIGESSKKNMKETISCGIFGSEQGNEIVLNVLYELMKTKNYISSVLMNTMTKAISNSKNAKILPYSVLTAKDWKTRELAITNETIGVQLYYGSWLKGFKFDLDELEIEVKKYENHS